ncbi:MAG: PHP domain-containing protein [Methylococcaceae bacterium]|nr:PHP domain-containing protein [Methylococcaceae bacterium]
MIERYDLHSHSTASDGALSPSELVVRAQQQGVTALALTDHDTIQGLDEAKQAAALNGIQLINGIEISTTWENHCLHIVGLNINPEHVSLKTGIAHLQAIRSERAQKIAFKLEKKRIPGAYEAVTLAAGKGMITRSHFADFLLQQNHVSTQQEAFDRYLGQGKPAYVSTTWASLNDTLNWITAAGGVAVLAHPMRYKLSANWMNRLLSAFKESGGQGIEVITGRSSPEEITLTSQYIKRYGLYGSVGSDFHSPANQWVELGRLKPLPEIIKPVWALF